MRQTASDVIEAQSFLKKHFEALPVGLGELPTTALTEPTHIICTSLVSAANNNSSAPSLTRPCIIHAHTHTATLPLHGGYTHLSIHTHTHTHKHTHTDIHYLLTQADKYTFKCLLMWRRSVKASAKCNSNIIKMTRAASARGDLKYSKWLWRDNVREEKCEEIANRLLCERWMQTAFKFCCFQHILSPVKTLKRKSWFHHRNFSPVRETLRETLQQGPGS